MKILKINVYGFGKWQDQQFDLASGLTVFSGPNEAGKSTLRQFILSVLFGFRTKRGADRYLRYEPKNGSKYGGELLIEAQGQQFLITRVKGKSGGKLTVTNVKTQAVLPNETLENLLGPVDETLFNEMFSFSQTELAEVRQLNRDEFRKRVLKIGAVGSDQWIGLQSSFEKSADKIYAPKGRVRPLNKLLKKYETLSEEIQTAAKETAEYKIQLASVNENRIKLIQLQKEISERNAQLDKLKHDLSGWEAYQRYLEISSKLDVKFSKMPSDSIETIEHLHQQLEETKQVIKNLQEKINNLEQEKQENPRILFYRSHQQQLKEIQQNLTSIQNTSTQTSRLKKAQSEIEEEKAQIQLQVGTKEGVPEPFDNTEFMNLQVDLKQKNEKDHLKQTIQAQIVELQNKLLQTNNSEEGQFAGKPKSIFLAISILVIIVPWLVNLSLGIKLGLLVLGLLGIVGSHFLFANKKQASNADLNEQLESLKKQLQEIMAQLNDLTNQITEIGVKKDLEQSDPQTWPAMQNDLTRFKQLTQSEQTNESQIKKNQQIISEFTKKIRLLADWVVLTGTIDQQIENIETYFKEITNDQQEFQKTKQDLQYYQDRLNQLKLENKQNQDLETTQLQKLSLTDWHSFVTAKDLQLEQNHLETQCAQLKQQLGEVTLTDLQKFNTQEEIQKQLNAQEELLSQLRAEQEKLVEQKTVLGTQMQQLANDETYANLQQQKANLEAEILAQTRNWLTEKLAAQWIDETLLVASQGRLPRIMANAEQYFSLLTNKRYNKISFDDETIVVFDANHQNYEVGELSQGTAEQLYVSIRLAFVKVMADLIDLPIIIDDGFVNFDSVRKQNVMTLLDQISEQHQVIYFTADDESDNSNTGAQIIRLN